MAERILPLTGSLGIHQAKEERLTGIRVSVSDILKDKRSSRSDRQPCLGAAAAAALCACSNAVLGRQH